MTLIEELIEKAKGCPKRVALPECDAVKTLLAAKKVLDEKIGIPVLVSDPAVIAQTAKEAGVDVSGMEIVDCTDEAAAEALVSRYWKEDMLISEKACKRKIKNPMYYAMMLEAVGEVDCTFCGHVNTTGDVLLAASTIIGMQEGVDVPSIFALCEIPGFHGSEGNRIVFADCGLNPEPTPGELASIAIASADNVHALMGWEPRVAFLSFSTCGSGTAGSVDRILEALAIAKERRPDLKMDGEFQLDAAIDPEVAAKKITRPSDVAGKANILIFPELNAANIGVKMMQKFAGGAGYGHTLSGFAKPVADSSRGATVEEIVGDIAMVILAANK
ncbi:MAG: phosphate acetyltransferase [Agathobacter sp.]|uniref:phosphate acyltransferase n=1 Tax=Agathobacter sp. TaxID=2021311 RepID=UPI002579A521|nr:phosphate acyltransferase [Agathobacter sp.]MBQ1681279.1 phosphate acetyltransferase [Agathobacter sp.]MCR5677741.1 phosphate acetyltransferase [Agathobacter sp.]